MLIAIFYVKIRLNELKQKIRLMDLVQKKNHLFSNETDI